MLEQADEELTKDESSTHPRTLIAVSNPLTAPGIVDLALAMRFPDSSIPGDFYALHIEPSAQRQLSLRPLHKP